MAKAGARIATALAWSGLLATSGAQPGPFLDFYGKDGKLYANGKEFKVKGLNWFGQESKQRVPYGLWERPLTELLDFVAENGFNTLRFFISLQNVAENLPTPRHFDTEDSQELVGTDFIGMVQAIARRAAERGILLLLANHQVRNGYPDDWPGKWDGTWFDDEFDEERVLQIWTQLAESFCTDAHWNVMGVDIMNEPYDLQWDVWAAAANRIGNHVLKHCPRWLVFVEGTGNEPPADPGMEWGENMIGVRHKRIRLSNDSKLVYSPHVYGPGLFEANNLAEPEYMGRPGFPGSCRAVWDRHFGYVRDLTKRPLIIGETGGHFRGRDREWQQEMVRWSVEKGFGLIYFALNPNTHDTGGVLLDDWTTPNEAKLRMLAALPSTRVDSIVDVPVPRPVLPPPAPAPAAAVPDCEWHGRSDIAPRLCSDITSERACELFWTSGTSPAVVCSWVLLHGRQSCDGHEAEPCPQPPAPPSLPVAPSPPGPPPPPPDEPLFLLESNETFGEGAFVIGGGPAPPPHQGFGGSTLTRLTVGLTLLAALFASLSRIKESVRRRYRRVGFRAVGTDSMLNGRRHPFGRAAAACGRVWQALKMAINEERQHFRGDEAVDDDEAPVFTISDSDPPADEDCAEALRPEATVPSEAALRHQAPVTPLPVPAIVPLPVPPLPAPVGVAGVAAPAAQPEPSAQEPMEQRQGGGSIEQQLSELLGSPAPIAPGTDGAGVAVPAPPAALEDPVLVLDEPTVHAVEEAQKQLVVLVMMPLDGVSDDEDEDAVDSAVATLHVPDIDDIETIVELRIAIKECFEAAEALQQHTSSDFDLWYASSAGGRLMVTASTSVHVVLQAERVWLSPNVSERPARRRPGGSGAQPYRPKYETTLKLDPNDTVKWMSTSLD